MSPHHGLIQQLCRGVGLRAFPRIQKRDAHFDGRNRLRNFWTPTVQKKQSPSEEDGHDRLLRAGFLRQAHSGIFHLLPLGLRVQDKVERLIDKHMQRLGASKVSLSSLSSQDLWQKSGRLDGRNAELFQLQDRKEAKFLLSPTHEEEITTIVKNAVSSYRDLPLRLYQVSRKYRDESRPRQGLLRGREFIMKDLYTFDSTAEQAMQTYERVRAAYKGFFDDISLPYLVANADSGNMGGTHSHEYHFASPRGEDTIISCTNCKTSMNEELFLGVYDGVQKHDGAVQILYGRVLEASQPIDAEDESSEQSVEGKPDGTPDPRRIQRLVQITIPDGEEINLHAVKRLVPDLDTTVSLVDASDISRLKLPGFEGAAWQQLHDPCITKDAIPQTLESAPSSNQSQPTPFLLTKPKTSDTCPTCKTTGTLHFRQAVEIGHTFYLGKRYSTPLEASYKDENNQQVAIEMGCHGIGVSRLVGAVASLLADDKGLNWPISIAPFGVVVLGAGSTTGEEISGMYDHLGLGLAGNGLDLVIDDREKPIGWKLNDADLIGYPFIVVLGKAWKQRRAVELQCRRLGVKEEVNGKELVERILQYRKRL